MRYINIVRRSHVGTFESEGTRIVLGILCSINFFQWPY